MTCRSIDEMASSIADAALDEDSFVRLLGSLINEAKFLQNNPPELVPVEDRGKCTFPCIHVHGTPLTLWATAPVNQIWIHLFMILSNLLTCAHALMHYCSAKPQALLLLIPAPTSYRPSAARHVLDMLTPYSTDNGGPLKIKHVSFVEGRGNIIGEATATASMSYADEAMPA